MPPKSQWLTYEQVRFCESAAPFLSALQWLHCIPPIVSPRYPAQVISRILSFWVCAKVQGLSPFTGLRPHLSAMRWKLWSKLHVRKSSFLVH